MFNINMPEQKNEWIVAEKKPFESNFLTESCAHLCRRRWVARGRNLSRRSHSSVRPCCSHTSGIRRFHGRSFPPRWHRCDRYTCRVCRAAESLQNQRGRRKSPPDRRHSEDLVTHTLSCWRGPEGFGLIEDILSKAFTLNNFLDEVISQPPEVAGVSLLFPVSTPTSPDPVCSAALLQRVLLQVSLNCLQLNK